MTARTLRVLFLDDDPADIQAVLELSRGRAPGAIVNRAVLDNLIWQKRLAGFRAR